MLLQRYPDPLTMFARSSQNTAMEELSITVTKVTDTEIWGEMPVDHRHLQPAGILHGGITCVFAETLGSYGSWLLVDPEVNAIVGQQISCNHMRPVPSGHSIHGKAEIVHAGRKSHIWDITIYNEAGKKTAISRLTVAVIDAMAPAGEKS